MNKEEVLRMIQIAFDTLIHTDLLIYPCGGLDKEVQRKMNGLPYIDRLGKPEFVDMQDYRKSLLELISKLIDFYKVV